MYVNDIEKNRLIWPFDSDNADSIYVEFKILYLKTKLKLVVKMFSLLCAQKCKMYFKIYKNR